MSLSLLTVSEIKEILNNLFPEPIYYSDFEKFHILSKDKRILNQELDSLKNKIINKHHAVNVSHKKQEHEKKTLFLLNQRLTSLNVNYELLSKTVASCLAKR